MTVELSTIQKALGMVQPGTVAGMFGGEQCSIPLGAALPTMKLMRETPTFQTPGGDIIKEFTGHIIFWHNSNQFYARARCGRALRACTPLRMPHPLLVGFRSYQP